jgi:pimeloyl-ACP methyl ester carboxylesterase
VSAVPEDEFATLAANAAEVGLPWVGPPAVQRVSVADAEGRTLSAIRWGQLDPQVVLVHGAAQNAHTWDTVALALGRPAVAPDLPGHGRSDWRSDHDYRPEVLADALEVVVERLAPHASTVVGMSLGGLSALVLAARRPELVRRLVLVDITPGVDAAKARAIVEFVAGPERFGSFEEILARTVAHNPGRSASSLRRGVIHNARQLPDGSWAWRWDPQRRIRLGEEVDSAALWDALGATRMPLTLVRAGRSAVVDDADVAELRRRRPDAEVLVVDDAGHSVQGDQPLVLAEIIAERSESG